MGQIRIEPPPEKNSHPDIASRGQQRTWRTALLFIGPLVFLVGGVIVYLINASFEIVLPSYQIVRFAGPVEMYLADTRSWSRLTRKEPKIGNKIRTGEGADIDLKIPGLVDLRLKPSSELELRPEQRGRRLRLKLIHGSLLVLTGEALSQFGIDIETQRFLASTQNGSFLISEEGESGKSLVSVLDGAVQVKPRYFKEVTEVDQLRIVSMGPYEMDVAIPRRVTYQEWREVNEVRDLIMTTAEVIKQQHDLRNQAGSLFRYVFDEGVFYTPNRGYAHREFVEAADGKIVLRADYDVYPQGSFSGLYFKTRDLDLSKVRRMNFELRAQPGKPVPDLVRLELKDGMSIVRGFAAKPISDEWRLYSFDFNAQKVTPISEVVFVFENSRIGPLSTKGTVDIKNLTIE